MRGAYRCGLHQVPHPAHTASPSALASVTWGAAAPPTPNLLRVVLRMLVLGNHDPHLPKPHVLNLLNVSRKCGEASASDLSKPYLKKKRITHIWKSAWIIKLRAQGSSTKWKHLCNHLLNQEIEHSSTLFRPLPSPSPQQVTTILRVTPVNWFGLFLNFVEMKSRSILITLLLMDI